MTSMASRSSLEISKLFMRCMQGMISSFRMPTPSATRASSQLMNSDAATSFSFWRGGRTGEGCVRSRQGPRNASVRPGQGTQQPTGCAGAASYSRRHRPIEHKPVTTNVRDLLPVQAEHTQLIYSSRFKMPRPRAAFPQLPSELRHVPLCNYYLPDFCPAAVAQQGQVPPGQAQERQLCCSRQPRSESCQQTSLLGWFVSCCEQDVIRGSEKAINITNKYRGGEKGANGRCNH